MIHPALHRDPVAVDRQLHRAWRLQLPVDVAAATRTLNACFLHGAEVAQACLEYPVVFVPAGQDAGGQVQVAPMAVLGLVRGENLYARPDGSWGAQYLPAQLRCYPFAMAAVDAEQAALVVDRACAGLWQGPESDAGAAPAESAPLFEADGEPSPLVARMQQQLLALEAEVARTQRACQRLMELSLLQEMRLDITQPDGTVLRVDGFMAVNEDALLRLPDATLAELVRSGLMRLIHAHQLSLPHMRRLAEWRVARAAAH